MALRIGTSTAGSTFYTQGSAIAELLNRGGLVGEMKVIEMTMASVDNANRLVSFLMPKGRSRRFCLKCPFTGASRWKKARSLLHAELFLGLLKVAKIHVLLRGG